MPLIAYRCRKSTNEYNVVSQENVEDYYYSVDNFLARQKCDFPHTVIMSPDRPIRAGNRKLRIRKKDGFINIDNNTYFLIQDIKD